MNKEQLYTRLRKTSIKNRLLFLFLVQAIIVLLWCFTLVKQSVSNYTDSISFHNAQIISTFQEDIDSAINTLSSVTKFPIINYAYRDSTILNELAKETHSLKNYTYNKIIQKDIATLLDMNTNIHLISVMDKTGSHVYCTSKDTSSYYTAIDSPNSGYYQKAVAAKGKLVIMEASVFESLNISSPEDGIYGIRALYSIKPYQSVGAVLCCIDMSYGMTFFQLSKSFPEQNIGVYEPNGSFLVGSISTDLYSTLKEQQKDNLVTNQLYTSVLKVNNRSMLYHYALSDKNYLCVVETPYSLIISKIVETKFLLFFFLILLVISMISITIQLVKSIESPIRKLSKACEEIKEEKFGIIVDDNASDEMNELIQSFNSMSKKIHYLIEEVYHKESIQLKTELQFLRSQINPHFVYNTLETIRSSALLNNNTAISEMTSLFGKILRYGISNSATLVPAKTELDNLIDYITLQKIHFKDRLIVNMNIESEIYNCNLIKLILQPLVENSIYHGITTISHIGIIDILGYCDSDTLIFNVSDNGIGVSEEKVTLINDYINERNSAFKGIGLKNVNRRIQLFYGNEYGITFHSVINSGSLIILRIPITTIKDKNISEDGINDKHISS